MISEESVRVFLDQELDVDVATLTRDTTLFSSGIVDSFSLVALMSFIEDNGGIRVSPSEVNLENFDTIERIMAYLQSKL